MSQSEDNTLSKPNNKEVQISEEKRKEAEERLKKLVPDMDPNQVMKMMYNNIKKKKEKKPKKSSKKFQEDSGDSDGGQVQKSQKSQKGSKRSRTSSGKEKRIQKREKDEPFIGRFKHKTPSTAKLQNQPISGMQVSARAKLDSFKRKIEIQELSQEDVYTQEQEQDPQEKKILQSITQKVQHHLKSHGDPLTLNQRQIYSYLMQKQKQYHKGRNFKKWSIRMRRQYLEFVTFNDQIKKYYLDKIGRQEITYDEIEKYNKECRFEGMMKYLPRKLRHIINGRYKRDHKEEFEEINDKKKIFGIKGEGAQRPPGEYEYEEEGLDTDFLKRYFSIFAPHNRFLYATALKTEKRAYATSVQRKVRSPEFIIKSDEDIRNLTQIKTAVKILIVKGYSTKGMRAYMQDSKMKRDQYHKFMMAVVRISFRMLQKFMREKVDKSLMYLHHKIVLMMCTPLLNIKFYFSKQEGQTAMKLWRLVFDVEDFKDKLTKSELINLYYACRRRQYERQVQRVTPRDVRYLTESYQNEHNERMHLRKIKYFKYLENPSQNEIGSAEGIYAFDEIFEDEIQEDQVSRFTFQFQLEVIKLYLRSRKYQQIRKTLLDRVNEIQKYRGRYDMDMIRKVCDKLFRRIIKYLQYEFITCCKVFSKNKVTYSEKKLLTMSACEKEILISRDDQNDAKFLIFDYYLNNAYKKNKTQRTHWEYPKMYLQYTIEAICDFFQTKRHLKSIKMGTSEEQYKYYALSSVYNEHYLNERERLMYENHYHKKISSVYGDGPREIINCADDGYSATRNSSNNDARSIASYGSKDGLINNRNGLKVETSNNQSQSQRFNEISVSQLKPAIHILELSEIKVYSDRLNAAHSSIDHISLTVEQMSRLNQADKLYCMISRMTKNMTNNYAAFLHFNKHRQTFDVADKYYDDGLTPQQKEEQERKRFSDVKNSLTPELMSYIVKKEQRIKKDKGIDEDEDDQCDESRSIGKSNNVKRNQSDDEDEKVERKQKDDNEDEDNDEDNDEDIEQEDE